MGLHPLLQTLQACTDSMGKKHVILAAALLSLRVGLHHSLQLLQVCTNYLLHACGSFVHNEGGHCCDAVGLHGLGDARPADRTHNREELQASTAFLTYNLYDVT